MKRSFTVRQGALEGVEAFLGVARHRNFRRAAAELGFEAPTGLEEGLARTLAWYKEAGWLP